MSKVNFYTGLSCGLMLFVGLTIWQMQPELAQGALKQECYITDATAHEIHKLGTLDTDNLDIYLAWMLKAEFETNCQDISYEKSLATLANKELNFEQKQKLALKLAGIKVVETQLQSNVCGLAEEQNMLTKAIEFLAADQIQQAQMVMANLSLKNIAEADLATEILYWQNKLTSVDPNCDTNLEV